MRKPKLNSLRMFDAAARHLNFRLAAEDLNLTQGAVAQQVRQLENDLGLKLFRRVARGVVLTETGRSYHDSIQQALAIIDDATHKLHADNSNNANITLSVTPSIASKWLVPRLASFAEIHPEIEVQTIASEEVASFYSDGVDIAIRQGHPPFGENLDVRLLALLDLRAVCSPDYARQAGPVQRLEDFSAHKLIQDGHRQWEKLFEDKKIAIPGRMMKFNQTALAMDAAANGHGVALVPKLLIDAELAGGKLVQLWNDQRENQQGYYVLYPNTPEPNPSARSIVVDWLLSESGNLPGL